MQIAPGLSEPQKHRAFVPLCIKCSDTGGGADRSLGGEPHRVAGDDLARHVPEARAEVRTTLEPDEAVLRDVNAVLGEDRRAEGLRAERRDQDLQAVHLPAQSHASGLDLRWPRISVQVWTLRSGLDSGQT